MADTPFKIQMNQDGAILKTAQYVEESFLVMPDYIKLEKASYPRMTVNPIEPWTEEEPPPEDYGKNVIDDTFEEGWYYTFYCDTTRSSSNKNGSFEEPYTNFYTAIDKIKRFFEYICCNIIAIRLVVKGSIKLKNLPYSAKSFKGLNFIIDCSEAEFYYTLSEYSDHYSGTTIGVEDAYIYNLKISSISKVTQHALVLNRLRIYNLTPELGTDISFCTISKINKPINDRYIDSYYETIFITGCHIKNVNNTDFICPLYVRAPYSISYITECVLNVEQEFYNIMMIDSTTNNKQHSGYTSGTDFTNCFFYRSKVFLVCGCKIATTYFYNTEIKSTIDLIGVDLEQSSHLMYLELNNTCIFDSEIKNTVKLPLNAGFKEQCAIRADWDNKMTVIKNSSISMNGTLVNRPTDSCACIGYGAVEYASVRDYNLFIINCELSETVISPLPSHCSDEYNCEDIWL